MPLIRTLHRQLILTELIKKKDLSSIFAVPIAYRAGARTHWRTPSALRISRSIASVEDVKAVAIMDDLNFVGSPASVLSSYDNLYRDCKGKDDY